MLDEGSSDAVHAPYPSPSHSRTPSVCEWGPGFEPASGAATPVAFAEAHALEVAAAPKAGHVLAWDELGYAVAAGGAKRCVFAQLSGYADPGEVLAVMGPSGSGKTSLLNALSCRVAATSGRLTVNAVPVSPPELRHLAAFVPQDDALLGFLTVEEAIRFSAALHLPGGPRERGAIVEGVLRELGLAHVRHARIGSPIVRGVSGGERRRVSIGVELVARKPIVLLDEPTSGLDSAASFQVVSLLKRYAREHHSTIVCTIHQPSSQTFHLFDRLALLAFGRTVFFGAAADVAAHFARLGHPVPANTNTADHILRLVNADFDEDRAEAHRAIAELAERSSALCPPFTVIPGAAVAPPGYGTSTARQVAVLAHRGFINARRNLALYWVRFALFLPLAVLIGTIWLRVGTAYPAVQNRLGIHFFGMAFPSAMAMASIPAFLEERHVFDREYRCGSYRAASHVIAVTLMALPFNLLVSLSFLGIAYPAVQLHPGGRAFARYALVHFLALFAGESLAMAVSAVFPVFVVALAIVAFCHGFFMILTGFFIRYVDIPGFWIWGHYWSYHKYAFEALVKIDLDGLEFSCMDTGNGTCGCGYADPLNAVCRFSGGAVLGELGFGGISVAAWCVVLAALSAAYRVMYGFFLAHPPRWLHERMQ